MISLYLTLDHMLLLLLALLVIRFCWYSRFSLFFFMHDPCLLNTFVFQFLPSFFFSFTLFILINLLYYTRSVMLYAVGFLLLPRHMLGMSKSNVVLMSF